MKNINPIKIFNDLFDRLNITKNDKLLVSSNLISLMIYFKTKKIKFDLRLLIELLKKRLGEKGTLIFPTYNWDFCNGKNFHYKFTPSQTGHLSNLALRMGFVRSKNPIYSFVSWGKDSRYISTLEHNSCFGLNSPYGYMIENNGKNLFIGINFKNALAFVHVAEEIVGVNFREFKYFEGKCKYATGEINKKIRMYVRKNNCNVVTEISEKMDKELIKQNGFKNKNLGECNFTIIELAKAHEIMVKDLKKNSRIIYPKKINS